MNATTALYDGTKERLASVGMSVPFEYGKPRCFVISLTPFDEAEKIDEADFRAHLRRLGDGGVGVYVAGGASGEAFTFTPEENRMVLRVAAEELKGRAPVRAMGIEPRSAQQMLDFAALAAEAGLDAVQIYSLDQGHGLRPTDGELRNYYEEVLSGVTLPAVLSSHHLAGYVLPLPLLKDLVEKFPAIISINVSSPDLNYVIQLIDALKDRVEIHVGGMAQVLAALSLGGHGFLSSQGNLAPKLSQAVVDCWFAGDVPGTADAFAAGPAHSRGRRARRPLTRDQRGAPATGAPRRPCSPPPHGRHRRREGRHRRDDHRPRSARRRDRCMTEPPRLTIEERLSLLEDEREIMRTLYRYCHSLDYGHEDDLLDCFTEHGIWESQPRVMDESSFPDRRFEGREAIRGWFLRHTHAPELFHKHLVAAPIIVVAGDEARVESYQMRIDEHAEGPFIRSFGRYDDLLVRCPDARWRIQHRLVRSDGYVTGKGVPHLA